MGWYEDELANAAKVQVVGPKYADEFSKLTGADWVYVDLRKPSDLEDRIARTSFMLTHTATGANVHVSIEAHTKKATCTVSVPDMPDGSQLATHTSRSMFRDYRFTNPDGTSADQPTAGVSLDRFFDHVPACAKRFVNMVAKPYISLYPQIVATIAEKKAGYEQRDIAAAELASTFHGEIHHLSRGLTVHFNNGLPAVEVSYGGHVRFVYTPNVTRKTLGAMFQSIIEEQGKNG